MTHAAVVPLRPASSVCEFCEQPHEPGAIIWLTAEELAERFRTKPSTCRDWARRPGVGPQGSAVFGKRRLWPKCSVDRWQQQQIEASR